MTQSFISKLIGKAAGLFGRSWGLTNTTTSISPTALLENFIPGYGPIHKFLLVTFGIDVTVIVSLGAVLWLADRITNLLWAKIDYWREEYWMSEIYVDSGDEIYDHLKAYLAFLDETRTSQRLRAETKPPSTWEVIEEPGTAVEEGKTKYHNFSEQEAKSQPIFTPGPGRQKFRYDGVQFIIKSTEDTSLRGVGNAPSLVDKKSLSLGCWGRSTDPVKEFLSAAKDHYYHQRISRTVVKVPASEHARRYVDRNPWKMMAERPHRPPGSVLLDDNVKRRLLDDINEYLAPKTREWYTNKGIPYRRGYLFYGPPGTGKSSLTCVIAGIFGLVIHVVSLRGSTITEEGLGALFMALPEKCIILLEDIDTAGLRRDNNKSGKVDELDEEDRISLSGLLNIIDGVASHEGRVLIMTTNRLADLDDALIRPGRVDYQVPFHNATQEQARELFEGMYAADNTGITEEELKSLAKKFSKPIDNGQFSMAELQGYLLKYKKDPRKACEEIENGIKDMLKVKGAGRELDPRQISVLGWIKEIVFKDWIKLMSRG